MDNILAQSIEHLNIILLMGLAIFFGTAGARMFRRFHVPQVVGYLVAGLIFGPSFRAVQSITLPVVASGEDDGFIGVVNCRAARRSLSADVLAHQQEADSASTAQHT